MLLSAGTAETQTLPDRDWETEYRKFAPPMIEMPK